MGTQYADLSPTYFTLVIRANKMSERDTGMEKGTNKKIITDNCFINIVIHLVWQQNLLSS